MFDRGCQGMGERDWVQAEQTLRALRQAEASGFAGRGGSLCSCRNGLALGSMGHGLSASGPIPGCGSPNPLPPALPVPRTHPGTRSSRSYLVGGCRLLLTQTVRLR